MRKSDLLTSIQALEDGNLIVYPTDTLYALGADVYNIDAVTKVFKLKNRPMTNPLPIAVADVDAIEKIAFVPDSAKRVANCFLPGQLTLVLKKKTTDLDVVTGGRKNVAVRIPDNKIALELLAEYGPLTVTSANIHGEETPYVLKEIEMQFTKGDVAVFLDVGRLEGQPSTIVDVTSDKPVILRQGVITENEILDAI